MSQNAIPRARLQGFSLIELLVSMAIGLVVTLAITSVMIRGEGSKRSTTSVNDINQSGSYAAFVLDREIRSAGSGFSQHWDSAYGCQLYAGQSSPAAAQLLPMPTAIPANSAFKNMGQTYRLAPLVVWKGAADDGANRRGDVLVVMGGTAGFSETGSLLKNVTPASLTITPPTTMPFDPPIVPANKLKSVILLADPSVPAGCLVTEVNKSSGVDLTLGGAYYSSATAVKLDNFFPATSTTYAMQLGTEDDNRPNFHLLGVGPQNTLMSYDLLAVPSVPGPDSPIADGVVEMRALYGLDTTLPVPDGVLDSWIDPGTAPFDAATLTNGLDASQKNLRRIVAVRIGFILRTSLEEQAKSASDGGYTAPDNIYLFSDAVDKNGASLMITRPVPAAEKHYRYRTFEVTVPLRNVVLAQ